MRVWAVSNQKGGVGKTTTAVTLAALLSARGERTLLLDLDPHGSLSSYFGFDPDTAEESVYSLFSEGVSAVSRLAQSLPFSGMDLLPASTAMATLDRQLGTQDGKGLVISRALDRVSMHYDCAIIDCPPMLGVLMVNALAACERLIVPVQTEFLALKGLERMLHTLTMITRARHQQLPYIVVPTLFDRRTRASTESLRHLRERYADNVWSGVIPVDTQFRDASQAGVPLPLFKPGGRGTLAYSGLLDVLLAASEQRVKDDAVAMQ
ncbi:MAG: ParA family protein [Gammaproteobacteria bacterium]|nr:ParA family protein [Gammaproteobacteria bacterium]